MRILKHYSMLLAPFLATLIPVFCCGCRAKGTVEQHVTIDLSAISRHVVVFHEITRAAAIPKAVINEFGGGFANPAQRFQSTDPIQDQGLPSRRLVVAGVSDRYCIIHYECGGIANSSLVVLFELSESKATVVWVSNTIRVSNLRGLKTVLESTRPQNQLGHVVL
jgi:hypothetical protein